MQQNHPIEQNVRAASLLSLATILWLIPMVCALPAALQGISLAASAFCALAAALSYYRLAETEAHEAIWRKARRQATLSRASLWSLAQEDAYTQEFFFSTSPLGEADSYREVGEVSEAGEVAEVAGGEWEVTGSVKDKAWYRALKQANYPTTTAALKGLWGISGGKSYAPASEYVRELYDRGDRENWGTN